MIQNIKAQNVSHKAFTLIEMVIVLIIMWIMLMFTVSLSGDQIQKVKNKAVKESIVAEMQTRYSRNLWSSSFAWKMYNNMEVIFASWENKIDFNYNLINNEVWENTFTNNFRIKYMVVNYTEWKKPNNPNDEIILEYSPYKISCKIGGDETYKNMVIITRINENKDYCFEIKQKNCRLTEMSEESCNKFKQDAWIKDN